ncbi:MAG: NAD-dependent epimerase/dehydratase family protein [Candidatus Thorarchaeota archaeon]
MSFLVTGATGLIGHYILREILEEDHADEIIAYDLYPNMDLIKDIADSVTVVQGDILDKKKLFSIVEKYKPKYIIHGAALRYDTCFENPTDCIMVNCIGTNNIFDAAILAETKRVVFMSSQNVYGTNDSYYWKEKPLTVNEDDPSTAKQPYGTTKWVNEAMAHTYYVKHGLDTLGFRITGVWGHGRYGGKGTVCFLNEFIRDVGLEKKAEVPAKLLGRTNLTWAYGKNAAKWLVQSCYVDRPTRRIYNMGADPPYSFDDILEILRNLIPRVKIESPEGKPERTEASKRIGKFEGYIDCTRMYSELGFNREFNTEEAIRDFINFHREGEDLPLI